MCRVLTLAAALAFTPACAPAIGLIVLRTVNAAGGMGYSAYELKRAQDQARAASVPAPKEEEHEE